MEQRVFANPAVVGLAGFGGTTLLLQFHNLGWSGAGTILWCGLFFGGLAQFIAGFKEYGLGNNFGFSAFCTYGAFWMSFAGILLAMELGIGNITTTDVGWFLVMFTVITFIYMIGSFRVSWGSSFIFFTLFLGLIFLDISHLGGPAVFTKIAAVVLIFCGLAALYVMAVTVLGQFGWKLPNGKGWLAK